MVIYSHCLKRTTSKFWDFRIQTTFGVIIQLIVAKFLIVFEGTTFVVKAVKLETLSSIPAACYVSDDVWLYDFSSLIIALKAITLGPASIKTK